MTAFNIDNLVKSYPRSSFKLRIKQLSLQEGSIMGLLGVNGAGKTSLLKLLLQITFPDAGNIDWTKNTSQATDFIVNNVSYMPEYKNLYHNLSTGSMLTLSARTIPGWNNNRAEKLLSVFPLDLGKKISTLSYGEKTRLYAVITFSKDVPYIILDEPSRGLDPVMQERMLEQVKLASLEDKTVIFSSHQLSEIEETADTAAVIKNGGIILNGCLDELKSSLFLLAAPPQLELSPAHDLPFAIIARRKQSGQDILLCQGTKSSRSLLTETGKVFDANLKDIFLTINEGEVQQ